jgi:hypothetical protein
MLIASGMSHAQEVTDPTPLQTRDQIRLEQQQRLQEMTPEERSLYREMNADQTRNMEGTGSGKRQNRKGEGKGKGDMKRLRDGSGNGGASRAEYHQRFEQRSSYGSGFGSRMGGGHGRH